MRLTGLTLRRYGPFAETALAFDPAPGRINLVLAPNGAGKSVLRHAFGELLFGIGGQTPMGFRHGYPGMQLAATGLAPDGTAVAFTRRKGNKGTLTGGGTGAGEAPLEQAWLDRLLGRADAKLLAQLYALDTERLRQGGRELLQSGGALAEALLAAAGGLREASTLRRALEEERDRLAPTRRVATRPFYAALDQWTESRNLLRQSLLRPEAWAAREAELRAAEAERDAGNAAAREAAERLRRLERIRRVRPLLARHDGAAAWLAEHPDAPLLPPGLAGRLPEARAGLAAAAIGLDHARAALARLDGEIAAIVTDDALLACADRLEPLVGMVALAAQALAGLPEAEATAAQARERVAAALARLGHAGAADPAALLPSPGLVATLRRLMTEAAAQEAARASLPRRLDDQRRRLETATAALSALPPPGDDATLEAVLGEIRREGDPARLLAAAGRAVSEARAGLDAALARLPAGIPEGPAAPDPAALERLAAARDAARRLGEQRAEAVRRAEAALAGLDREQAALAAGGDPPPSREALSEARARREAGWHLLYRRLSGEAPDAAAERGYGGTQPLVLAYREAVARADRVADALWGDAGRVAQAEGLARQIREREAERSAARRALDEALAASGAAEAAWDAATAPLGLGGGASLAEAQRALALRETALAARRALATAEAAVAERRSWQDSLARRLGHALGESPDGELPVLMDRAEERLRRQRAAEGERRARQAEAQAARQALEEAERERDEIAGRQEGWEAEWRAALAALRQPAGTTPAGLEEALGVHDALARALGELSRQEARLSEWRAVLRRLEEGYAGLCRALALSPGPDALAGLRELDRRQRAEAALAERRAGLEEQRARQATAVGGAEEALRAAEATLRAVLAAIGATTPEQAELRLALGQERARRDAGRAEAEAELLAAGDGLSLAALRAEAEAQPAALEADLEEARTAQQHHAGLAQAAVALATALELELRRLAGDDVAVQAATSEAAATSRIGQALNDALLVQVAGELLEAALAAVQEGTDDSLLRRISAAFAMLTEGAYARVASQEDERGTARLVLRARDFPEEETGVEQLSEGTRDQLFLALRLVAIEDQAANGTRLPFLGDDILQSFDDARAAAALRALLALSGTVQVILLSHHEHLAAVAQRCLPAGALHLQRL